MWARLETTGVLEERLLDHVWMDHLDQKSALIGLMDRFDLICERVPPKTVSLFLYQLLFLFCFVFCVFFSVFFFFFFSSESKTTLFTMANHETSLKQFVI